MREKLEKNRWPVLVNNAMCQNLCAFPSLWAVFQPYVAQQYGYTGSAAAFVMALCLVFFGLIAIVAGRMNDHVGPRKTGTVGLVLLPLSFLIAYLIPAGNPFFMYLGFCLPYGAGCGFIMQAANPCGMRWFADKKGFFSGVAGALNALYIMVAVFAAEFLLAQFGARRAMLAFGAGSALVALAARQFLISPTIEYLEEKDALGRQVDARRKRVPAHWVDFAPQQMLRTAQYYLLITAVVCAVPAMQLLSSQLVSVCVAKGLTKRAALSAASIGAAAGAIGRFCIPFFSDRLGHKRVICISWAFLFFARVGFMFAQGNGAVLAYALMCAVYGGGYAMIGPLTNDMFGFRNGSINSACVNVASSAGAVGGPLLLAALVPLLGGQAVHVLGVFGAGAALCCMLAVNTNTAKTKEKMELKMLKRSERH